MKNSTSRRASKSRKSAGSRASGTHAVASVPKAAEFMSLKARARAERDMIASALDDAPALDRDGMGAQQFPFNEIASSRPVEKVVAKIVAQRLVDNPWIAAHAALMATDQNGRGYAEFTDACRDVAFLAGVDYALRAFPVWWPALLKLDADTQQHIGVLVTYRVRGDKGGAQ